MIGYGTSLSVGIGVPIPVLDEEVALRAAVSDEEIFAPVIDYSQDYPQFNPSAIQEVSYAQLRSGSITVKGKEVPTGALSSYSRARQIAEELKGWIKKGDFLLSEPVASLPQVESGYTFKPLKERPIEEEKL